MNRFYNSAEFQPLRTQTFKKFKIFYSIFKNPNLTEDEIDRVDTYNIQAQFRYRSKIRCLLRVVCRDYRGYGNYLIWLHFLWEIFYFFSLNYWKSRFTKQNICPVEDTPKIGFKFVKMLKYTKHLFHTFTSKNFTVIDQFFENTLLFNI